MRPLVRGFLAVWLLVPAGLLFAGAQADVRPNFVIIYIDDLGWMDTGFQGSTYYETPNADRIAREGMVFRSAYANGPNCAPSRASLLSGQYTPRHGVYTVGKPERGPDNLRRWAAVPSATELKATSFTIAEALRGSGYVTACIGKWHLGADPYLGPHAQGFDVALAG